MQIEELERTNSELLKKNKRIPLRELDKKNSVQQLQIEELERKISELLKKNKRIRELDKKNSL